MPPDVSADRDGSVSAAPTDATGAPSIDPSMTVDATSAAFTARFLSRWGRDGGRCERTVSTMPTSVMQSAGFRRLLGSASAVIFGVMGQAVARGWLAKDLTGSNAGLGGVMLAFGGSMLLATPWGGVAADRFQKRTVLFVAVMMLTASSFAVGVAVVADHIEYWMLVVASMIQAVAFALYLPARIAFIAELVEPSQIGPAVVLSQTVNEAMRVVAPALAGVLIGARWFGVGGVFFLAAGTATLAAILLTGSPPGHPRSRRPVRRSPRWSTPSGTCGRGAASGSSRSRRSAWS